MSATAQFGGAAVVELILDLVYLRAGDAGGAASVRYVPGRSRRTRPDDSDGQCAAQRRSQPLPPPMLRLRCVRRIRLHRRRDAWDSNPDDGQGSTEGETRGTQPLQRMPRQLWFALPRPTPLSATLVLTCLADRLRVPLAAAGGISTDGRMDPSVRVKLVPVEGSDAGWGGSTAMSQTGEEGGGAVGANDALGGGIQRATSLQGDRRRLQGAQAEPTCGEVYVQTTTMFSGDYYVHTLVPHA